MTQIQANTRGPLQWAARSAILLAMFSLPCGAAGLALLLMDLRFALIRFPLALFEIEFESMLAAQLPLGLLLLVFAFFLSRGRSWAVTLLIVIASMDAATVLLGLVCLFSYANWPMLWPFIVIGLLLLAAVGQFIYHLWLCYPAIRGEDNCVGRGFEPIMPPRRPAQRQDDTEHGP